MTYSEPSIYTKKTRSQIMKHTVKQPEVERFSGSA